MKPRFVRSAIFAAMVSAVPTYLALYNGLKHDTNSPQAIALSACIAFTISFAVTFFAQVAGGRWRKGQLEVSPWFAWFIIGTAILFVPGLIIFRHWSGTIILAAAWLVVLSSIRALVHFLKRKQPG
jgi:hypothetical protein